MPTENVIGANVMRLRVAKGISQKALAERAHLSRLGLAKIEHGALPRAATLRDLARALSVSTVELATEVRQLHTVRFRARKRVREREQLLAEVSNWLDDYCFLEELLGDSSSFVLSEFCERRDLDEQGLAEAVRKKLELEDQPIHDICGLLERCGVKVLRLPRATDAFFGLSVKEDDGGPAIVINTWERISVERWIFSAAHELAHLLLHPGAYDYREEEEPKEEERQADLFASFFLMPRESFEKEWHDASGHPFYERVLKVKRIFHVSYKTVLLRLIHNGESKDLFRIFQMQHKRRFGRTLKKADEPQPLTENEFDARRGLEPDRLSDTDCLDDRLRRLVRQAVENEEISLGRGAEVLGMSLMDMRQLAAEWAT